MRAKVNAPRGKDLRDFVSKITLTANDEEDQKMLSLLNLTIFSGHYSRGNDGMDKLYAWLKRHNRSYKQS